MKPIEAPADLTDFLRLSRLVRPIPLFPDIKQIITSERQKALEDKDSDPIKREIIELNSKNYDDWVVTALKSAWHRIVEISEESGYKNLITYIHKEVGQWREIIEADWLQFFDIFIERHRTIRSLADHLPLILAGELWHGAEQIIYYNEDNEIISKEFILPFYIPIQPALTKHGRLNIFHDSFLKILFETDVRRLRVCPVCSYVFWAYQSHQKWCSAKCKRTGSKRKILADSEERARVNKRRRENYQRSKKLNDIKENKNGTL